MHRGIEARIQKLEVAMRPFALQTDLSHLTPGQLSDLLCAHKITSKGMRPHLHRRTTDEDRAEWAKLPHRVRDWGSVSVRMATANVPKGELAVYVDCHKCGRSGWLFDVSRAKTQDLDALTALYDDNDVIESPNYKAFELLAYELIERGELDFVLYEEGRDYQENYTDELRIC